MASQYMKTEQIGQLQDAFRLHDTDDDGLVNFREVGYIMRAVGQNPSEAELQVLIKMNVLLPIYYKEMMMSVEKDSTGSIDFPQFLSMMALKINAENAEDEVREAFIVFDGDGNGFINRQELSIVMANIGEKLTQDEIQAMIDEADVDGDGQINYEEFYNMMT